jgi:putative transposase
LVDTLGLSVAVVVMAAHGDAGEGLVALVNRYGADGVPRLRQRWGAVGYRADGLRAWGWGLQHTHKIDSEGVEHTGKGLQGVPQWWVGERTCAWLLHYRRQRCDEEALPASSEAMLQISMMRLLLKRLA